MSRVDVKYTDANQWAAIRFDGTEFIVKLCYVRTVNTIIYRGSSYMSTLSRRNPNIWVSSDSIMVPGHQIYIINDTVQGTRNIQMKFKMFVKRSLWSISVCFVLFALTICVTIIYH